MGSDVSKIRITNVNPHRPTIVVPSAKYPPGETDRLNVIVATTDNEVNHCVEVFDVNKSLIGRETAVADANFTYIMLAEVPVNPPMVRGGIYYVRVSTECNDGGEAHTIMFTIP